MTPDERTMLDALMTVMLTGRHPRDDGVREAYARWKAVEENTVCPSARAPLIVPPEAWVARHARRTAGRWVPVA